MPGRYGRARTALAAVAAAVLASLPGTAGAAAAAGSAAAVAQSPYGFQPGARSLAGATGTASAPALGPGGTYRDAIDAGASRVYRVDLDARTDTYVSVVAVPREGATADPGDLLTVTMQNRDGTVCTAGSAHFGTVASFPHPVVAEAARTADPGAPSGCAGAGSFYAVVRRSGAAAPGRWDLEIRRFDEPPLVRAEPARAPAPGPSGSPAPPAGTARDAAGGSGFHDAAPLTGGTWTTRIRPGQSLFFRVPVGWGQRLFAGEDLTGSRGTSGGGVLGGLLDLVPGALSVSLYNPALAPVAEDDTLAYQGADRSTAIGPLAPVAHANRYAPRPDRSALRFAGWYYLEVTLNPQVGRVWGDTGYRLSLRIDVAGERQAAPDYVRPLSGFPLPGGAVAGTPGAGVSRTVGVLALAAGTALLGGLGAWTLVARRGAGARGGRA